ncbi:MAG: DUF1593 domain-containing protein [Sphingomonas fennica]
MRAKAGIVGLMLALAVPAAAAPTYLETPAGEKPRVVITADPELDDNNSLIRYLLHAPDFRTEGLIYASSQFHWRGDGKGTRFSRPGREYNRFGLNLCPCTSWRWAPDERFIDDAVDAYAAAYPNLSRHDPAYPTPAALRATIRWGNVDFDGEMEKDTPGSTLIAGLLLDDEQSPIYLHAWGGQSTIARALKSIEERYAGTPQWPAVRSRVIAKAVIHPSGDQDDTYRDYIAKVWPEIRYRRLDGGIPLGYGAQARVSPSDSAFFTADWTRRNVSSRGPLGALYRVWGDGKQMVKGDVMDYFGESGKSADQLRAEGFVVWTPPRGQGEFLGEGDTTTFLNLVDNGLAGYRGDMFGGWGGYARTTPEPSFGELLAAMSAPGAAARPPLPRLPTHPFLAAAQNDLAARFSWATTADVRAANHPPRVTLAGAALRTVRPGEAVPIAATARDPDGDRLALRWWQWPEAGRYAGRAAPARGQPGTPFVVPADARAGDRFDIVAEAEDTGTPPLTAYGRMVLTVAAPDAR